MDQDSNAPQHSSPSSPPHPRRAATANKRADASRQKILDAAVAEFGEKGFSGARTASIARRAGVNVQLISYYFGGKQGLLEELRSRWSHVQAHLVPADTGLLESLRAHLDLTLDDPDWARLAVWNSLEASSRGTQPPEQAETSTQLDQFRAAVTRMGERQQAGEVFPDVDAGFISLLTHLVAFAPIALPQFVAGLTGMDPLAKEYRDYCIAQMSALVCDRTAGTTNTGDIPGS